MRAIEPCHFCATETITRLRAHSLPPLESIDAIVARSYDGQRTITAARCLERTLVGPSASSTSELPEEKIKC